MAQIKKIVNLTPHDINVVDDDGNNIISFPSQGTVRLSSDIVSGGSVKDVSGVNIPLTKTSFGNPQGLPDKDGRLFIVSSLVAQACPNRDDLLIVNDTVRDDSGKIIGCRSFSVNPFFRGK